MLYYYKAVLPKPIGPVTIPIPRQAIAEASKQVQAMVIAKALKKRVMVGLMQRQVQV